MPAKSHCISMPDLVRKTFNIQRTSGGFLRTSVKMTRVHWDCLLEEAAGRGITLADLVTGIWNKRPSSQNVAETLRKHCVEYLKQRLRESNERLEGCARVGDPTLLDRIISICPCPCLIFDTDHVVTSGNPVFYRWLHMIPGAADGKRLESFLILRKKGSMEPLIAVQQGIFHYGPGEAIYISPSNGSKRASIQIMPLQSGSMKQKEALLIFEVLCPAT